MAAKSLIELADRKSRLRPILFATATVVFLFVQVLTRPPFSSEPFVHGWRLHAWALNAGLLLLCLGGGGGILHGRKLRDLINDEVAQHNYRRACTSGFWISMIVALVISSVPRLMQLTSHQAVYLVVTAGTATAMLVFSWLEWRSHADA